MPTDPKKKKSAVRESKPLADSPKPKTVQDLIKEKEARRRELNRIRREAAVEKNQKAEKKRRLAVEAAKRQRSANYEQHLIRKHGLDTRRKPTKPKHI